MLKRLFNTRYFIITLLLTPILSQSMALPPVNEKSLPLTPVMAEINASLVEQSYQDYLIADSLINEKEGVYNPQLAFNTLLKANLYPEQTHPKSAYELGLMYQFWPMWNLDYENSMSDIWYRFTAFITGKHNDFFYKEALDKYIESAQLGNSEAFGAIGEMYLYGLGVYQNTETAYHWFVIGNHFQDYRSIQHMNSIKEHFLPPQEKNINQSLSQFFKTLQLPNGQKMNDLWNTSYLTTKQHSGNIATLKLEQ